MNNSEILALANTAYKKAKTRDFREQMKPLETCMASFLINFYHLSVITERENCAKLCDEQGKLIGSTGTTCAKAIRARGEA
tara:strand:+ start:1543 stop:1785 length:243 start_codon:yes stop_codon:yes gene_type:complete